MSPFPSKRDWDMLPIKGRVHPKHGIELQARQSMIKKGLHNPGLSDRETRSSISLNNLFI